MNCYFCNSDNLTIIVDKNNIRYICFNKNKKIYLCNECSLIQLLPQWNNLEHLYEKYNKKRKKEIRKYLLKYCKKTDNCLEIGPGNCDTLDYLINKNRNIIGIEIDKNIQNVNVIHDDFSKLPLIKIFNKFDFIYGIHVLEHFKNPIKIIEKTRKLLTDNGNFLFEIPNVEDPLLLLYKNKAFFKFYWYPYHHFYFSKKSIQKLFDKMNIKIDIILKQRYGIINHLYWLIFKKPSNINFKIPILDFLYQIWLIKILKISDTMIIVGKNERH